MFEGRQRGRVERDDVREGRSEAGFVGEGVPRREREAADAAAERAGAVGRMGGDDEDVVARADEVADEAGDPGSSGLPPGPGFEPLRSGPRRRLPPRGSPPDSTASPCGLVTGYASPRRVPRLGDRHGRAAEVAVDLLVEAGFPL